MKGTFILSIDVELAWGFVGGEIKGEHLETVRKAREILEPLLKIIEDFEIPTSWAILGHAFLDRCECKDGRPHPDMPRPDYSWFAGDWYKYDPCSSVECDPVWYGKDVVEKIFYSAKNNSMDQDICCHSFSHQIFSDPGCSEKLARAEIDKCLEIMKNYGLRPTIFVFPVGMVGYINLLKEKGFVAFRSGVPELVQRYRSLERSTKNIFRKYLSLGIEFLSYYLPVSPPVVFPKQVLPGLWDVPGSMCFCKKRKIPMSLVVLKAKRGIERAVKEKKCFVMFTHLHNFGVNPTLLLKSFEDILSFADKKRKQGMLQIVNIKELIKMLNTSNMS